MAIVSNAERRDSGEIFWTPLGEGGIDVSGIGGGRQLVKPASDGIRVDPIAVLERLALAQYRIETGVAERAAPFDAGARDVALDQGKLERQRLNGLPETGQYLGLETFDVDLDEGGHTVPRDQRIDGRERNTQTLGPGLAFPAGCAGGRGDEIRRHSRDGRVVEIDA